MTSPAPLVARQPRLKRGQARVAGLLAAGADVFAAKGYDAATMTEIAAAAGAAIGSLYQFFPTKQLLAEALHVQLSAELSATLDTLRNGVADRNAADTVDEMLAAMTGFLGRHPAFNTLSDRRDGDRDRKLAARHRIRRQIADLLEGCRDRIAPVHARAVAALVLEVMKSMILFSTDDDPAVRDGSVAVLREMFRRQLS